jgi:ribosomal protein S6
LENQQKPKKKKSKIAQVYKMHQKGAGVKEIAEKMKLSERVVRSYIWRAKNPEKYKALLQRYFEKKRQKKETEAIKAAVKNQNSERSEEPCSK